jgi:hypothetical protein
MEPPCSTAPAGRSATPPGTRGWSKASRSHLRQRTRPDRPPVVPVVRGAGADRTISADCHAGSLPAGAGGPAGRHQRWAAAERGLAARTLARSSTMEPWMALLRALLCRDGVDQMRADAEAAVAGLARGARGGRRPCSWRTLPMSWPARPTAPTRSWPTRSRSPYTSVPCPPPRPPWPSAPWS